MRGSWRVAPPHLVLFTRRMRPFLRRRPSRSFMPDTCWRRRVSRRSIEPRSSCKAAKIKEIRDGYLDAAALQLPADTRVIDLTGMFVMPGFIDLHVHLSGGAEGGRDLSLRESDNYFTIVAYRSATATLMGGFTTVRDLGSEGYTDSRPARCDPRRHRSGTAHRRIGRSDQPDQRTCRQSQSARRTAQRHTSSRHLQRRRRLPPRRARSDSPRRGCHQGHGDRGHAG